MEFARPHRARLVAGGALVAATVVLSFPGPWILKLLIDEALPRHDKRRFALLLIAFGALFLLRGVLILFRNRVLQFTAMRLVCDLRIRLFSHLQSLSLRYFDANQTGKISSRITQDTNEVYQLTNGFLINFISDSITLVFVLGVLFCVQWRLALAVSVLLPLFALNYARNRQHMKEESRIHRDNWDGVSGFLTERLAAARVVKAFAREEAESRAFARAINADYLNYSRIVMRNTRMAVSAELLGGVGALIVLGYGGWLVLSGAMPIGTLIAFNAYIAYIFPPIVRFVDIGEVMQRAQTAIENISALLDTTPEIVDRPGAISLPSVRGDVEFRQVCFNYETGNPRAGRPQTLRDIQFHIPAGCTVAIVGPSGAGKSTIINLVARFYDVDSGQVLIDGHDVRDVTLESLRSQIGIVLQENVLFSGTLEDNIRYGRPDASRDDVHAAALAANVHEFAVGLPEGYDTLIGERGARLSGGQRQRIAIARAILRDPRILIFDEATSALDAQSEKLVQDAMDRLLRGRTAFIIAHRLSTIRRADVILAFERGRLVEMGSHDRLRSAGGLYARLLGLQLQPA